MLTVLLQTAGRLKYRNVTFFIVTQGHLKHTCHVAHLGEKSGPVRSLAILPCIPFNDNISSIPQTRSLYTSKAQMRPAVIL